MAAFSPFEALISPTKNEHSERTIWRYQVVADCVSPTLRYDAARILILGRPATPPRNTVLKKQKIYRPKWCSNRRSSSWLPHPTKSYPPQTAGKDRQQSSWIVFEGILATEKTMAETCRSYIRLHFSNVVLRCPFLLDGLVKICLEPFWSTAKWGDLRILKTSMVKNATTLLFVSTPPSSLTAGFPKNWWFGSMFLLGTFRGYFQVPAVCFRGCKFLWFIHCMVPRYPLLPETRKLRDFSSCIRKSGW